MNGLETMKSLEQKKIASKSKKYCKAFEDEEVPDTIVDPDESKEAFLKRIRESIIGDNEVFVSPFGERKITYCDYTASGRAVTFIEDYIREEVLTMYANTHTTTSITGFQTTLFRHEARMLIKRAVNANFSKGNDKDVLIFVGSGVTGAVSSLVQMLNVAEFCRNRPDARAVVFVGPYEHHSNLLPWREANAEVVEIGLDKSGKIDTKQLEKELLRYSGENRELMIGAFSAASNVTGQLTDTDKITVLLHKYGAFSVWDYATAGPYVKIDMNPIIPGVNRSLSAKDAIFISPHKFVGGVGTPGVLIVKKRLISNPVPAHPGGGTVFFVTEQDHRYLKKKEEREEGGTPDIVGSIRAGLVFQLKRNVGEEVIMKKEEYFCHKALNELQKNPDVIILGLKNVPRLSVLSFVIAHRPSGKMLHYNFVSALLNDLFGIQTRGGCVCAGPFAQKLLGMSYEVAKQFEEVLLDDDDNEILRPGFVRLNFNYFMDENVVDYVIRCIDFVAREGWKVMPEYFYYPDTGEWFHYKNKKFPGRRWLGDINYKSGSIQYQTKHKREENINCIFDYEEEAKEIVSECVKKYKGPSFVAKTPDISISEETLRWFVYPSEVLKFVTGKDFLFGVDSHGNLSTPSSSSSGLFFSSPFSPINPFNGFDPLCDGDEGTDMSGFVLLNGHSNNDVANGNCHLTEMNGVTENGIYEKTTDSVDSTTAENGTVETENCNQEQPTKTKAEKLELIMQTRDSNISDSDSFVSQMAGATFKFQKVPKKQIYSPTLRAMKFYNMIREGDRVLVGVSGGKDSLTLLHTLKQFQRQTKINFELGACTVDPMTAAYDPSPLIHYMKALGVPYFFESQDIIDLAKQKCATSICSWCARMKRGVLYTTARRENYNVLAMGQHLDDLAESLIMSCFYNGRLRTMKACYTVDEGDLRVIRPFVYVRERDLKEFAYQKGLPVISENCPACFEIPKERERVKTLLASQEHIVPNLFGSLLKAMAPLMSEDLDIESNRIKKNKRKLQTKNFKIQAAETLNSNSTEINNNKTEKQNINTENKTTANSESKQETKGKERKEQRSTGKEKSKSSRKQKIEKEMENIKIEKEQKLVLDQTSTLFLERELQTRMDSKFLFYKNFYEAHNNNNSHHTNPLHLLVGASACLFPLAWIGWHHFSQKKK